MSHSMLAAGTMATASSVVGLLVFHFNKRLVSDVTLSKDKHNVILNSVGLLKPHSRQVPLRQFIQSLPYEFEKMPKDKMVVLHLDAKNRFDSVFLDLKHDLLEGKALKPLAKKLI